MTARRVFIPPGRLAEYVPAHPERTSLRAGRSWDSDTEVREWPSRGAMLQACRMSDTGVLGAPPPMRDYLASRYPAALAWHASQRLAVPDPAPFTCAACGQYACVDCKVHAGL